jgi:hypothetical protein
MNKRSIGVVVGLMLVAVAVVSSPIAFSQMEPMPTVYTYVSQFQIPRANWAAYSEDAEKSFVPVAEKLVADGSIISWSTFETIVHTPDGYTHGAAWSSTSISGLMKVLDEIRKGSPRPSQIAATKHEDLLMQTSMYAMGAGGGAPAYLRVVCQNAKPDQPEGYAAAVKKYIWPMVEEQIKKGAVSYVGFDQQYVNTSAPSLRCLVISFPNADGVDKWANAVNANFAKMSAADREAFFGSTVTDSRRDFMARITHAGHK